MIGLRMKIKIDAVGVMLIPGSTREEAEAELTEEGLAKLKDEVIDGWRNDLKEADFELSEASVEVELVEI